MFIYAGGRQSGKTSKIIDWFLVDPLNRVIVTPDAAQANRIIKQITNTKGKGFPFLNHIFPYHNASGTLFGTRGLQVGIDNVDMVLSNLLHSQVDFATVTGVKFDVPSKRHWWRKFR